MLVKLKDYLDIRRGPGLPSKFYSETGRLIRLTLGNFNYPNGGFKENTSKKDIYYIGNIKKEYILKKGDLITPLTEQVSGLLGETAWIPENNKYIQNGDIGLVIPYEGKLNAKYCYYLLSSPLIKKQLGDGAQQTKIRHTSPEKIKACVAPIPDIKKQELIGKTLHSIDEQINRNKNMIKKLQVLVQSIYSYWFNQFEYPNNDGKPYKTSGGKMAWNEKLNKEIPEGWEVIELLNFCSWESASQPPKSEFIYEPRDGYIRFIQNRDYESNDNMTYIPLKKNTKLCNEYDIMIDKYGDKTAGTVRYGISGAYNVALGKLTTFIINRQEYLRYFLSTENLLKGHVI